MKTPHKHAEIIKAWADGADIEWRNEMFKGWKPLGLQPTWSEDIEYRVKAEPKLSAEADDLILRLLDKATQFGELGTASLEGETNCAADKLKAYILNLEQRP